MSNSKLPHPELFEKIRKVVDEDVRPYLMSHGGDLDIVDFDEDKKLHIKLHGACSSCPAAGATLYYVVQDALEEAFPDEGIEIVQVA